jgi:hypothetical protein
MSKLESTLVGLFVGIACPLLTFVVFWWSAALIHMRTSSFPLRMVIAMALTGLSLGLLLDVLFLRKWVQRFYMANLWLMSIIYLCLCIVAVAFFMGLPAGTIVLGIAAGVYMGRRENHVHIDGINAIPTLRKTALITASVTAMAALPIGILALNEQDILIVLENLSGLDQASIRGFAGFTLIGLLCVLLFLIQYWFSKKAGLLAFNIGTGNAQHWSAVDAAARRD